MRPAHAEPRCFGVQQRTAAYAMYGAMAGCLSLLNHLFVVFHVEAFTQSFRLSREAFWVGETIFLIWNCVNDPLFGWLSDMRGRAGEATETGAAVVRRRLQIIRRSGPLMAAAFLALWFPWPGAWLALQFGLCLCIYDTFLTLVDLHYNALLADMLTSEAERARVSAYGTVFSLAGSASVFLGYSWWNRNDPGHFQQYCLAVAMVAGVGFYACASGLLTYFDNVHSGGSLEQILWHKDPPQRPQQRADRTTSLRVYLKQLSGHRNLLVFSAMNVLQVFHCHFNSNFFPLFLVRVLGLDGEHWAGSALLAASFLMPYANNLVFLRLCVRHGAYTVVRWLFWAKLALSGALLGCQAALGEGPGSRVGFVATAAFLMANRVFTEGTCKLLNLVVADLVHEDMLRYRRPQPVAAMVFGSAAILSKPGQTLAPVLGAALILRLSGVDMFHADEALSTVTDATQSLQVLRALAVVSFVAGLLQTLVWRHFTLHGDRLRAVKLAAQAYLNPDPESSLHHSPLRFA